jgi:hypothetical protein
MDVTRCGVPLRDVAQPSAGIQVTSSQVAFTIPTTMSGSVGMVEMLHAKSVIFLVVAFLTLASSLDTS